MQAQKIYFKEPTCRGAGASGGSERVGPGPGPGRRGTVTYAGVGTVPVLPVELVGSITCAV